MRLIDEDELKKRAMKLMFRDAPECGEFDAVAVDDIDCMPTIDPESLRPTANWINETDAVGDPIIWTCSACKEPIVLYEGTPIENAYNYCPTCGARMVNADEKHCT